MKHQIIGYLIIIAICIAFMVWKYNAVMALDMPEAVKWLLFLR